MKINQTLLICTLLIPSLLFADSLEEFGKTTVDFYRAPSKEKFEVFQQQAAELEDMLCKNDNGADLMVSVMFARIAEKHSWPIRDNSKIGKTAKEVLKGQSKLAKYVADDNQVDPGKLDLWWASYFATGEEAYLEKILKYAGEKMPEGNINKLLIIGAATWSFKSNCEQHAAIRAYASKCINDPQYAHKKAYLQECKGVAKPSGFSWRDENGNPVPDTENRKTKDDFGAELLITDNINFYEDWKKPETPNIAIAGRAQIGKTVIPLVIYVNPKLDEKKNIDVTCDFTIIRPDGSIAQEIPDVPCGSGEVNVPQYNLLLSRSELRWSADKGDPTGKWKFNVTVKDNNRGIKIPLTTSIEITE